MSTSGLRAFDAPARMSYVNALFIIGSLGTLITPAVLESWSRLNWSAEGLGLIAGIELAGLGLGALSGLYWQQRWNWRTVAVPSLLAGVLGNLACLGADSYLVVCFARALVGIAGGFLCGVYSAYAANIVNPVRMIAITTFVQIALEALFIFFAPTLSHLGAGGLFVLMALLFALLAADPVRTTAMAQGAMCSGRHYRAHTVLAWLLDPRRLSSIPRGSDRRLHISRPVRGNGRTVDG
jgi:hypothetical protein